MNNKKAQITVFIIIGIVILVIVGMIYGASMMSSKQKTETQIIKAKESTLNVQPIKTFVESCLDRYAKEALILLGQQGGRILAEQGGTSFSFSYIENSPYKVAYAIFPPNPFLVPPEIYPWEDFPYVDGVPTFTGDFGDSSLPPFTKDDGAHSIQLQLETFVSNKMSECNLEVFENQFNIIRGTPKVSANIVKGTVIFNLDYNLEFEDLSSGAKTSMNEFQKTIKVRLGKIYELGMDMVTKDTGDIKFNIGDLSTPEMPITLEPHDGDDIIIIRDLMSKLTAAPYEFKFARKNRAPALHKITTLTIQKEVDGIITDITEFNEGEVVSASELVASTNDPDEDTVSLWFKLGGAKVPIFTVSCSQPTVEVCAFDGYEEDCQVVDILC